MRITLLALILFLPLLPMSHAQTQTLTPGSEVPVPEPLTGVWEMPLSRGAVGLSIQGSMLVYGQPRRLSGVHQQVASVMIGIYKRTGPELRPGDIGWYSDDNAGVSWADGKLVLPMASIGEIPTSAFLVFNRKRQLWTGQVQRGDLSTSVVLRRAAQASTRGLQGFTGTWWAPQDTASGWCLHLAQQPEGALSASIDHFVLTGRQRYAPGIVPPVTVPWTYGDIAAASRVGQSSILINFDPFAAGCCRLSFGGRLSADSRTIRGSLDSGPLIWHRMPRQSCRMNVAPRAITRRR